MIKKPTKPSKIQLSSETLRSLDIGQLAVDALRLVQGGHGDGHTYKCTATC